MNISSAGRTIVGMACGALMLLSCGLYVNAAERPTGVESNQLAEQEEELFIPVENNPTVSQIFHGNNPVGGLEQHPERQSLSYEQIPQNAPVRYLFIGDSRFVGMENSISTDKDICWIDRVGARHGFYWENRDTIASYDKNAIVIYELGVNDLDSGACVAALQDLVCLGFSRVYFSTTAPVDEAKAWTYGYTVTNAQINQFNDEVLANLPVGVGVIDAYYYLATQGIDSSDGIHYNPSTYDLWFGYLMQDAQ